MANQLATDRTPTELLICELPCCLAHEQRWWFQALLEATSKSLHAGFTDQASLSCLHVGGQGHPGRQQHGCARHQRFGGGDAEVLRRGRQNKPIGLLQQCLLSFPFHKAMPLHLGSKAERNRVALQLVQILRITLARNPKLPRSCWMALLEYRQGIEQQGQLLFRVDSGEKQKSCGTNSVASGLATKADVWRR